MKSKYSVEAAEINKAYQTLSRKVEEHSLDKRVKDYSASVKTRDGIVLGTGQASSYQEAFQQAVKEAGIEYSVTEHRVILSVHFVPQQAQQPGTPSGAAPSIRSPTGLTDLF